MMRLSDATLADLPGSIDRPRYDRRSVSPGVVHLGIGAFHRAHQAVIFERALDRGDLRWGIVGASLRSPAVHAQLAPQDGLYSLVVRDGADEQVRIIGAVQQVIVAPQQPGVLINRLAQATTHIVTLTITEKGYVLDPADADVAADHGSLAAPRTAPGFMVAALARRRDAGLPPFTAISCDNLPRNGARLRAAVLAIAAAHDPALAAWIEAKGAFPETMVDRIVPATDPADIAALGDRLGVEDRAMVKTEPFSRWVIEDRFCGPRPDFAAAGVELTASVAPWEAAKLRLLNGAHSSLAYLGALAGLATIDRVVALPAARRFVAALWDEAAATLTPPPGLDLAAYRHALMTRFANPALQHRTRQIAIDGSQKLPQRLVAPIAERLRRDLPVDALALGVAGWMRWQGGRDDAGERYVVDDPLAGLIAARLSGAATIADQVAALLSIEAIFPPELAAHPAFVVALVDRLDALTRRGARVVLENLA